MTQLPLNKEAPSLSHENDLYVVGWIFHSDDPFVFQKQFFFQSETCIWRQIIYFFYPFDF